MTYLIIAILMLLALPGVLIFGFTTYALNHKLPYELVDLMQGMSPEHKAAAKASFDRSKQLCRKATIYDVTAPYVMALVVPFLPWEAERLPKLFRKWDNEISLNGDRTNWVGDDGIGKRTPVPLEDTPEAREFCYYAKGHHPRSRWARYVWLGLRNRASLASYELGFEMTPELRADYEYWGDLLVGEKPDGVLREGTLVRRCGPFYEVYSIYVSGGKIQRTRFGYKIGNAIGRDPDIHRAMVVGIGLSFKRV